MDTEVLETNEIIVPSELTEYLKDDEKALETLNDKISSIVSKEEDLKKEIEDKQKEFEKRLEEFKKSLEKEKEEQAKIFSDRADDLSKEKDRINSIKSEQESKKQSYISSLININDSYLYNSPFKIEKFFSASSPGNKTVWLTNSPFFGRKTACISFPCPFSTRPSPRCPRRKSLPSE